MKLEITDAFNLPTAHLIAVTFAELLLLNRRKKILNVGKLSNSLSHPKYP